MKKSFLHRAIAFLLSIVVLLGLVGCGSSAEMHCSACGAENDNTAKFCVECGASLSVSTICQSCGQENDIDSKFCSSCGNTLSSQSTNQSTQNSETSDKTEGTNDDQTTIEPDPAKSVWLKLKEQTDSQLRIGMHSEYHYDCDGNLILQRVVADKSGLISASHKYIYTYDENNRVIKVACEGSGVEIEYTYHADGTIYEELDHVKRTYKIYEKGQLKFEYHCQGNNGDYWYELSEYHYDSTGKLTAEHLYNKMGSCPEFYTFDNMRKFKNMDFGENFLRVEYTYNSNGTIAERKSHEIRYDKDSGVISLTGETIVFTHTYKIDSNGNIVEEKITGSTGYNYNCTYEYMSLAEYREKGLYVSIDVDGNIYCAICKGAGHDKCQGHKCTECDGNGQMTCPGCKGSGKEPFEINGNDTCLTCLGAKTVYCDTCHGSGKWFFD